MSNLVPKLDQGLREAYRAWQETSTGEDDAGISITLSFTGSIEPLVDLGFRVHAVVGDMALGIVRFRDLPVLAERPEVLRMSAGSRAKKCLDTAVKDIRARASNLVSGAPADGLWHVPLDGGPQHAGYQNLTSIADGTGKDVIVAVIDTGIDYTHPAFMKQLKPERKTRILRIWDQGISPKNLDEAPDPKFLLSSEAYGVEYKKSQINESLAALDKTQKPTIDHRDCDGHGTHVACIAAGGPLFPSESGDTSHMGVAPEASIIVVKYLDTPRKIHYGTKSQPGDEVGDSNRIYDAIIYCLRTARSMDKAVVINMSFVKSAKPGDGLDEESRFIDVLVNPWYVEDEYHFPKGAILVKAAGNDGDRELRLVYRITVPQKGEIEIPFRLEDRRGKIQTEWRNCKHTLYEAPLFVDFWYRRTTAPLAVQFALRLPYGENYGADIAAADPPIPHKIGFRVWKGPTGMQYVTYPNPDKRMHRASLSHRDPGSVPHPFGGNVHRHYCEFRIEPKVVGNTVSYVDGIYWIRIKAPEGTVIFARGTIENFHEWIKVKGSFDFGGEIGAVPYTEIVPTSGEATLLLANLEKDKDKDNRLETLPKGIDETLPKGIELIRESTILDPYGQYVITVAAYDEVGHPLRKRDPAPPHSIADFSSRGPLRDYSDPFESVPVIPKPDIAAPGVKIESAESQFTEELLPKGMPPADAMGDRFVEHGGTSMAAPMVTGVIATLLDKDKSLNVDQVRAILQKPSNRRKGVHPAFGTPEHDKAYGAGMIDAFAAHKNNQNT